MSSLLWLLNTVGLSSIGPAGIISITGMAGIGCAAAKMQFDSIREQEKKEKIEKEFEKMNIKKKKVDIDLFNEEQYKTNETIKKDYEQMQVDKKDKELKEYDLVEKQCTANLNYKGIKVESYKQLLLGHDEKSNPVWGYDTNYIVAGTTGSGKTRKLYPILLNYLANQQGIVYICDLKGTDFKMFKGKRHVVTYIDELENVAEAVKGFEDEYNRRKELFNESNCIDIDDYNSKHDDKLRGFMLLIDEYADISDCYQDKNKRPVGVYKDIIQLARKCRAFGGRIVLGTQRPSVDVVCGTLKNNCTILGMRCINSLNSKIMVDTEGCERLSKTESLTVIDGMLTKLFAYKVTDPILRDYISKLK